MTSIDANPATTLVAVFIFRAMKMLPIEKQDRQERTSQDAAPFVLKQA
jgi:hypothetical protein